LGCCILYRWLRSIFFFKPQHSSQFINYNNEVKTTNSFGFGIGIVGGLCSASTNVFTNHNKNDLFSDVSPIRPKHWPLTKNNKNKFIFNNKRPKRKYSNNNNNNKRNNLSKSNSFNNNNNNNSEFYDSNEPLNDVYHNLAKFMTKQFCRNFKIRHRHQRQCRQSAQSNESIIKINDKSLLFKSSSPSSSSSVNKNKDCDNISISSNASSSNSTHRHRTTSSNRSSFGDYFEESLDLFNNQNSRHSRSSFSSNNSAFEFDEIQG
jgi:hypothetical protein